MWQTNNYIKHSAPIYVRTTHAFTSIILTNNQWSLTTKWKTAMQSLQIQMNIKLKHTKPLKNNCPVTTTARILQTYPASTINCRVKV